MSQNPQPVKTPPFCFQCAHFIAPPAEPEFSENPPRCRKFPMLDVVMGERFLVACHAVRSEGAPCGVHGTLFEPNDDLDKPAEPTSPAPVEPEKHDLN